MRKVSLLVFVLATIWSMSALAAPPLLPVQGRLLDSGGQPINGAQIVDFRIYGGPVGGASLYSAQQLIDFSDGYFIAYIGESPNSLPLSLFDGAPELFLGVEVDGDGEMTPRLRMGAAPSAPFANSCGTAETLGTFGPDDFAPVHDHPYSTTSHAHAGLYALTSHPHTGYADDGHLHSGVYALTSHPHSGYADDNHNHTGVYSPNSHLHAGIYALNSHGHSITSADIVDGTIANADLKNDAVNSAKVANDSLTAADLAPNSVGASELAPDSHSHGALQCSTPFTTVNVPPNTQFDHTTDCPSGSMTGGGYFAAGPIGGFYIAISRPFGNGWNVHGSNIGTSSQDVLVYVRCCSN